MSLVIERLEAMPPTGKHNYDYVVLQATNNSIPFYESMGFVRVGAVTEKNNHNPTATRNQGDNHHPVIATGPIMKITIHHRDSLRKICKHHGVDVYDVIFLNQDIFPGIAHKSVIQKGTELFIPDTSKLDGSSKANSDLGGSSSSGGKSLATQWYDALDNETPREIAKKFNVDLKQLLAANKGRIQGLQMHSKLVEK